MRQLGFKTLEIGGTTLSRAQMKNVAGGRYTNCKSEEDYLVSSQGASCTVYCTWTCDGGQTTTGGCNEYAICG